MRDLIIILSVCVIAVTGLTKPVEEVCQNIRECDDLICKELQKPSPLNETVVFNKIKTYIDAVYELVKCLHADKEGTVGVAKDIIDKKGAKFMIDLPWSFKIGLETYGWDGMVIYDYLNWRILTTDVWMDVEKYFDPTAYIPEELYTESSEKAL